MSIRVERPWCLAQLRAKSAPAAEAGDRPSATQAGGKSQAKRPGWQSSRHNRRRVPEGQRMRQSAAVSTVISLNCSINLEYAMRNT